HWQRGTFLHYGEHGTALLERRRREFHSTVRAAWPDYFMSGSMIESIPEDEDMSKIPDCLRLAPRTSRPGTPGLEV
ncbi:MAG: hypothetical protein GY953_13430, partial [bacterium]|nr:hypothetical protein [bacterium]